MKRTRLIAHQARPPLAQRGLPNPRRPALAPSQRAQARTMNQARPSLAQRGLPNPRRPPGQEQPASLLTRDPAGLDLEHPHISIACASSVSPWHAGHIRRLESLGTGRVASPAPGQVTRRGTNGSVVSVIPSIGLANETRDKTFNQLSCNSRIYQNPEGFCYFREDAL